MRVLAIVLAIVSHPANATEGVPCEGAAAMMRMMAMSMDSMKAYGSACAPDPTANPCMAISLAVVDAASTFEDDDGEKAGEFHRWLREECPNLPSAQN